MSDNLFGIVMSGISFLWIILSLVLAVLAFLRFRLTPSGLLVGGGFVIVFLKIILQVLVGFTLGRTQSGWEAMQVVNIFFQLVNVLTTLLVLGGIACIPWSLGRLARKKA